MIEKKFAKDDKITPGTLKEKGLIKKTFLPIKILSDGKLSKKLSFKDVAVSKAAKEKIKKAGGKVE